jgi:D-alanyl-D-alanine-carboxypeptidase/D-alanyl-D-alanine-endopeptidase
MMTRSFRACLEAPMQFALAALAFSLLTLSPVLAQAPEPDAARILADRIERDGQGKAMASATVVDGQTRFVSHGAGINETTLFEIGSLSKIFTNLLLAQLVDEGKIDLDAPASNYLPEGMALSLFDGQPVTLFDLATHSSGLPAIPPELGLADPANPYRHYDENLLETFLAAYPLPRAPGERFEYSNIGATLVGLAASHVAGQPYAQMVEERILEPLGMEDTMLVVPGDKLDRFAQGHDAAGEPVPHWDFDVFAPAGGWRSTAADMAKFLAAASGQVETPLAPAFALMLSRTRPADSPAMSIGLGWMILSRPGGQTIWHNGRTAGFNAFAGYDRDGGRAVVVLANAMTRTGIEDIGFHLVDGAAPLTPQPEHRVEVEIDPKLLANYVGTYELGPEFSITVTAEGERLFVKASGQERLEAFAESDTRFFLKAVDAQVSFATGPDGKAETIVLHQNGQDIPGTRK